MDDRFIKKIAVHTAIPAEVVEMVIKYSLEQFMEKTRTCESAEITGMGTFYLKKKAIPEYIRKFEKKIEKLKLHLTTLNNERAILNLEERIRTDERKVKEIKKRYELGTDIRGVEE